MTVLYLDSSAFIKLYVLENQTQTEQVEQAISAFPDVASSHLAFAEVCGAFGRQLHQQRLDEPVYWATRQAFESDWENVDIIPVNARISSLAADLLKAHQGLRAMDALHLASALSHRESTNIKFLSFDQALNAIATRMMPEAMP